MPASLARADHLLDEPLHEAVRHEAVMLRLATRFGDAALDGACRALAGSRPRAGALYREVVGLPWRAEHDALAPGLVAFVRARLATPGT